MEPTPLAFTPEQQGLLESLSRETGKPVAALIAQALEALQEDLRPARGNGERKSTAEEEAVPPPTEVQQPIWEKFIEASLEIPEEELDRLPTDGATQHDHYIYGTPKRPV